MLLGELELVVVLLMLAEEVGERPAMELAADHRLRLLLLGHDHGGQAVTAGRHPAVTADEVDVAGAVHQELGHDGVVVVVLGHVAVGTRLGRLAAARQMYAFLAYVARPLGRCTGGRRARCAARCC